MKRAFLACLAGLVLAATSAAAEPHVNAIRIAGSINPASSDFIQKAITRSADENAAALGGISAHAGLFSSARDLDRLARAYLSGGAVDGGRLARASTIALSPCAAHAGRAGISITMPISPARSNRPQPTRSYTGLASCL